MINSRASIGELLQ